VAVCTISDDNAVYQSQSPRRLRFINYESLWVANSASSRKLLSGDRCVQWRQPLTYDTELLRA
jgi:hypothetical protein